MSSKLFIPNDILETIVCLNCNDYLSVFPIYTKCDGSGAICGRCRLIEDDKYIRDEAFEGIAQFLVFPCKHSNNGCKEQLTPPKLEDHEHCCKFRKFDCPSKNYSKCQWKGARVDLAKHFEEKHPTLLLKDSSFELNFLNSQEEYLLLPYNGELFVIKKEVDARKGIFSCSVEHLKALEDSETYNYCIRVESGNRNYSHKCHDKTTCKNEKLNITLLTQDLLQEYLHDPASIIVNIVVFKASKNQIESVSDESEAKTNKVVDIKQNPDIQWDLLSELECPVCFDYILPPIFQCITGHSICETCKLKVNNACPLCKKHIQDTKNFSLEKMIQHFNYPCRFYKNGCHYYTKTSAIREHENSCEFGPYHCPLKESETCNWEGTHSEVFNHIDNNHNTFILKSDKVELPFDDKQETQKIFLIQYQKKIFKLLYKFENEKFYWCVQLVGPSNEAKLYRFEIDIIDPQSKRRCYFTGLVVPISDQKVKNDHYIMASLEQLKGFANATFSFRVRVVAD